jgi:uncharacterized OsmC-like protein
MDLKSKPTREFAVSLNYVGGYAFENQASENGSPQGPVYRSDEPDPVGDNSGPATPAMLGSAVAHCLSASLLEHMRFHGAATEPGCIRTDARITVHRGTEGLPRIRQIDVQIAADDGGTLGEDKRRSIERTYKKHCTVSASLEPAFPINTTVTWIEGDAQS